MHYQLISVVVWLTVAAAGAFDFSGYTVISPELKGVRRTNRESYLLNKRDPLFYAVSGYRLSDGLACLPATLGTLEPEVAVRMYGTNDAWSGDTMYFAALYAQYLDTLLDRGVVPVIRTIPPFRWYGGDTLDFDSGTVIFNRLIRRVATRNSVVLVDVWQAFMDYTNGRPFTDTWYDDRYIHPSECGAAGLTDTTAPACGLGIRNAVTWQAVNKVYRIIIENGMPDAGRSDGMVAATIRRPRIGVIWTSQVLSTGLCVVRVEGAGSTFVKKGFCP